MITLGRCFVTCYVASWTRGEGPKDRLVTSWLREGQKVGVENDDANQNLNLHFYRKSRRLHSLRPNPSSTRYYPTLVFVNFRFPGSFIICCVINVIIL